MNPILKSLWLVALRSGQYSQGFGKLQSGQEYCCLGVLCRVYEEYKGQSPSPRIIGIIPMPLIQQKEIGLLDCERLVVMNDTEHRSFPEIAAWIEANL